MCVFSSLHLAKLCLKSAHTSMEIMSHSICNAFYMFYSALCAVNLQIKSKASDKKWSSE